MHKLLNNLQQYCMRYVLKYLIIRQIMHLCCFLSWVLFYHIKLLRYPIAWSCDRSGKPCLGGSNLDQETQISLLINLLAEDLNKEPCADSAAYIGCCASEIAWSRKPNTWWIGHGAWSCGGLVMWWTGHVVDGSCGGLVMWWTSHVVDCSCGGLVMWWIGPVVDWS